MLGKIITVLKELYKMPWSSFYRTFDAPDTSGYDPTDALDCIMEDLIEHCRKQGDYRSINYLVEHGVLDLEHLSRLIEVWYTANNEVGPGEPWPRSIPEEEAFIMFFWEHVSAAREYLVKHFAEGIRRMGPERLGLRWTPQTHIAFPDEAHTQTKTTMLVLKRLKRKRLKRKRDVFPRGICGLVCAYVNTPPRVVVHQPGESAAKKLKQ